MKWNVIRHLGVVLGAVALATMLWGCSNVAPTGVPNEPSLQTQANNPPTGGGDSDTNKWW